jgi:hypothetical protein
MSLKSNSFGLFGICPCCAVVLKSMGELEGFYQTPQMNFGGCRKYHKKPEPVPRTKDIVS